MNTRVRPLAILSAVASTTALVATVWWAQRLDAVTITVLLAVAWGATVAVLDACNLRYRPAVASAASDRRASVTFVVRLGEEGLDIARTSLVLAAQAGPVAVVATRHHEVLDDLGGIEISEYNAATIAEAIAAAARDITTDAVLILSARAFPVGDACELAAAQLTGDVGWVIGTAPPFNTDHYAPGQRELMAARAREYGRGLGLLTWEPDATIVRTSLLREYALEGGRPDGRWLRARSAQGWRGETCPEPVARQAAPSDAPMFWPTRTKRLRGAVADLADAMTTGRPRARLVALGAVLRELYAYPAALWLAAIILIGRSGVLPMSVAPLTFFAVHGAAGFGRWVSSRLGYRVGLHPLDEVRGAAYDLPGSLLALPSALTRRVRPIRFDLPDQPLSWAALALTLATTIPLLDRRATNGTVSIAVGLALGALAATWVFALRAFGARGWDRATYRLAIDRPALIEGCPARTVDASPSGLAIVGAPTVLVRGSHAHTSVTFDDAHVANVVGRVTDVRRAGDRAAVGVALDLASDERVEWVRDLFAAAGATSRGAMVTPSSVARPLTFDRERPTLGRRLASAFQVTVVGAISALVLAALLLVLLGYRPMVVRSGSMVPTFRVGDVVVADWVRVDRIRPGEVVTFTGDVNGPTLVTHRVQRVEIRGGLVHVVTKGDANTEPEHWTAPRATLVGHVVWSFPSIGSVLVVLGESTVRWLLFGAAAVVVLLAGASATLRVRRSGPPARATAA